MSIINDALKKAQNNMNANPNTPWSDPVKPVEGAVPAPSTTKAKPAAPGWLAAVLVLVIMGAALFILSHFLSIGGWFSSAIAKTRRTVAQQTTQATSAPMATIPAPATTVPAAAQKPMTALDLKIHGVMTSGDQNLVLIGDNVYKEGDTVSGVKIIEIRQGYLTVDNGTGPQRIDVQQ